MTSPDADEYISPMPPLIGVAYSVSGPASAVSRTSVPLLIVQWSVVASKLGFKSSLILEASSVMCIFLASSNAVAADACSNWHASINIFLLEDTFAKCIAGQAYTAPTGAVAVLVTLVHEVVGSTSVDVPESEIATPLALNQ